VDRAPGRRTLHAFSFGSWYDAEHVSFGPMVCHDEHLLREGEGFPTHSHSDLVIVTCVVSGAVEHTDSAGASVTLGLGDVGILRTGASAEHSEVAAAPQTRFVQVWLTDPSPGGHPSYEVRQSPVEPVPGARFEVARLDANQAFSTPVAPRVQVFVSRGALLRSSLAEPLHDGDAFLFTDEPSYDLVAGVPAELLVWSFDA